MDSVGLKAGFVADCALKGATMARQNQATSRRVTSVMVDLVLLMLFLLATVARRNNASSVFKSFAATG
ncbi:hypothetical protein BH20ACI3_BH20ACI3_22920 [soil metagenome]